MITKGVYTLKYPSIHDIDKAVYVEVVYASGNCKVQRSDGSEFAIEYNAFDALYKRINEEEA